MIKIIPNSSSPTKVCINHIFAHGQQISYCYYVVVYVAKPKLEQDREYCTKPGYIFHLIENKNTLGHHGGGLLYYITVSIFYMNKFKFQIQLMLVYETKIS